MPNLTHTRPPSPDDMLARALATPAATPERLLGVAEVWIGRWSALADEHAAGAHLDGRADIYSGETYAEARDRWTTYRDLLRRRWPDVIPEQPPASRP